MQLIAVQNHSTVVSDADVQKWINAQQIQCNSDFASIYGRSAQLAFFPKNDIKDQHLISISWQVAILDNSDQAGALGYHDLTSGGMPLAKIFAKDTMSYGGSWTVTASHEVLEMLGDPYDDLTSVDQNTNRLYFYELCDAVEDDSLSYQIEGVSLSDFVLPEWFVAGTRNKPLSFRHHVNSAFELARGGYIGYLDFTSAQGWQQLQARVAVNTKTGVQHLEEYTHSPRTMRRIYIHKNGRQSLKRSEH